MKFRDNIATVFHQMMNPVFSKSVLFFMRPSSVMLLRRLNRSTLLLLVLLLNIEFVNGGAFDKVVDDPELPRVLLIGDSISIDYTPDTRKILKGKANVHRPACNCMFSGNVAANIGKWLGKSKWDVVHFNPLGKKQLAKKYPLQF
jgi:hypothetical protein